MNEFQDGLADTDARTLSERHMEGVRQQGGMFVEAVRVTRMPMLVTDAKLPGNPIIFCESGVHRPVWVLPQRIARTGPTLHEW
jgi:hypothetical protein